MSRRAEFRIVQDDGITIRHQWEDCTWTESVADGIPLTDVIEAIDNHALQHKVKAYEARLTDEPQHHFAGLLGLWGVPCTPEQRQDEQDRLAVGRARVAAEELRGERYEGAELAVRALRPIAGAFGEIDEYADAIIQLAERLGAYLENGV